MSESSTKKKWQEACRWVQVATADGLRLDGLLHVKRETEERESGQSEIPETRAQQRPVILLMHGAGANFYGPSLINRVGTHLHQVGWSVLRANNRGHDGWHVAFRGGRMVNLGAAFERMEEAVFDISAWCLWLKRNGFGPVWLVGHSLGAFKSLLFLDSLKRTASPEISAAPSGQVDVAGVVAISPPCLSQTLFESSDRGAEFLSTVRRCREWVEQGQIDQIMSVTYPFPMFISPGCYLNKYVSGERFNFTQWIDHLGQPIYWIFGEAELDSHVALAAGVKQLTSRLPESHQLKIVPQADHFFTGQTRDVAKEVARWMEQFR